MIATCAGYISVIGTHRRIYEPPGGPWGGAATRYTTGATGGVITATAWVGLRASFRNPYMEAILSC